MLKLMLKSSLYKPFCDTIPAEGETAFTGMSLLRNEPVSFQLLYWRDSGDTALDAALKIDCPLPYRAYDVKNHAVMRPTYASDDEYYLRKTPGMYPDALAELPGDSRLRALRNGVQSVWVTLNPDCITLDPGDYSVTLTMTTSAESFSERAVFHVVDALLPEQELIYTNWFHCDCLCDRYGCAMFSEEHWKLIESYAALAAKNGQNMILTPCFTPPLDTNIGGERMTAQLIDVKKTADGYAFGFDKLRRFFRVCEGVGIRYFEHSHLFTQWGALHAPKIMAETENGYERIFGWETDANNPDGEYAVFLGVYLTELKKVLEECGIGKRMYFHVSDEPGLKSLDDYTKARKIIAPYIEGFRQFDALSSFEFYQTGAVDIPIPTTTHCQPFLDSGVPDPWVYYTGGACYNGYSNRLISMPNARNRILGAQLWYIGAKGFLQWAYNFWYIRQSERMFDPWTSPDAEEYFVGGTSFMVYPGKDGPCPSIRLYSFAEGLNDQRALCLYERKVGREKARAFVEAHFPAFGLTCVPDEDAMFAFRQDLNRELE